MLFEDVDGVAEGMLAHRLCNPPAMLEMAAQKEPRLIGEERPGGGRQHGLPQRKEMAVRHHAACRYDGFAFDSRPHEDSRDSELRDECLDAHPARTRSGYGGGAAVSSAKYGVWIVSFSSRPGMRTSHHDASGAGLSPKPEGKGGQEDTADEEAEADDGGHEDEARQWATEQKVGAERDVDDPEQ